MSAESKAQPFSLTCDNAMITDATSHTHSALQGKGQTIKGLVDGKGKKKRKKKNKDIRVTN